MTQALRPLACRAAFISDVHLGTKRCEAELLLQFIKSLDCETLYLVGDIFDGWRLKKAWWWPQAHNDVVQKLLRMARAGVRMIYIPGNHDEAARDFCGLHFGGVVVAREMVHEAADGRRYLVTHGDAFDSAVHIPRWLAILGEWGYRALGAANSLNNRLRRATGREPWSLSNWLKSKVRNAREFIGRFEAAAAQEAGRRGLAGVICGHIHKAEQREIGGVVYINDGDWVESCTAAIEHPDGRFEIIHWRTIAATLHPDSAPAIRSAPARAA